MTQAEMKRRVGYVQPDFKETCGNCRNCTRRGCRLRCAKWGFAVVADGICRNGYEKPDAPLNERDTPLLTYSPEVSHVVERAFNFGDPVPLLIGYDPAFNSAVRDAGQEYGEAT